MIMGYVKNTWASGDTVTSEKLNHIETGVASAESGLFKIVCTITVDPDTGEQSTTLDKTTAEILEAYNNGKSPVVVMSVNGADLLLPVSSIQITDQYSVIIFQNVTFSSGATNTTMSLVLVQLVRIGGSDQVDSISESYTLTRNNS